MKKDKELKRKIEGKNKKRFSKKSKEERKMN